MNYEWLNKTKITHVLNVTHEVRNYYEAVSTDGSKKKRKELENRE